MSEANANAKANAWAQEVSPTSILWDFVNGMLPPVWSYDPQVKESAASFLAQQLHDKMEAWYAKGESDPGDIARDIHNLFFVTTISDKASYDVAIATLTFIAVWTAAQRKDLAGREK